MKTRFFIGYFLILTQMINSHAEHVRELVLKLAPQLKKSSELRRVVAAIIQRCECNENGPQCNKGKSNCICRQINDNLANSSILPPSEEF